MTNESTWIERDGKAFGARPDEQGPLGGGEGYRGVITQGEFTVRAMDELIDAVHTATAGQTVFLPDDVELDLTARIYIEQLVFDLPAGVTLASNRGHNGSPGALLRSDALKTDALLRAAGPGVRISGLRLRGPNGGRHLDHHRRSFAEGRGHDYYYKLPTSNGIVSHEDAIEVDNCEISRFSLGGVHLHRGRGHRVHHCYIHHCQYNGLGYGVCIDVAHAQIDHNLFNFNRHSIAGTGRSDSGYHAHHNVELGESLSHCFDMHGGRDRQDGTDIAGSKIVIAHNTFGARTTPIVIRGLPREETEIDHNWFPRHAGEQDAVHHGGGIRIGQNLYGTDGDARILP